MQRKAPIVNQHETLRVPSGWKEQDRMFVMQLERIFDDIYSRLNNIRYQDLSNDLKAKISSHEDNT